MLFIQGTDLFVVKCTFACFMFVTGIIKNRWECVCALPRIKTKWTLLTGHKLYKILYPLYSQTVLVGWYPVSVMKVLLSLIYNLYIQGYILLCLWPGTKMKLNGRLANRSHLMVVDWSVVHNVWRKTISAVLTYWN